jgi:tRNA(Ile)-lysidine synthase
MDLLQHFNKYIQEQKLFQAKDKLLLAVSGGVDSVVLCELCNLAGVPFSIAHCNFQLRGEESRRDEQFVQELGPAYGVEVFFQHFDTNAYAEQHKLSIQEAARALRYAWFEQLRMDKGFAFTVLAHHADDNIETLLMNFFRGTGLQGLTAMPQWNFTEKHLLRPLLNTRRKEIMEFARQQGLKWVEDSSNASSKYTRNFFRNELIPALKKVYPQVEENLLDNIERFKKINSLYLSSVQQIKREICEQRLAEVRIPILKLLKHQHTSLIYEIIKDFGFGEKQVDEVLKLTEAESGKFIENEYYQIIRHRNWLIIAPRLAHTDTIAIGKEDKEVKFSGGSITLDVIPIEKFNLNKSASVAQLDAKHIDFPLLVRKWKQGDYFYPLGMRKKKKLGRFFIDQKLSRNQKENVWVVESNKKIIWVAGLRIDDRFKITASTQQILQLKLTNP